MIIWIINIPGHDVIIIFPRLFISSLGSAPISLIIHQTQDCQEMMVYLNQEKGKLFFRPKLFQQETKVFQCCVVPDCRRWMRELQLRDRMTENRFSAVSPFQSSIYLE